MLSRCLVLALALCSGLLIQSLDMSPLTVIYQVSEEQPAGTKVGRLVDDLRQRGVMGSLEDFHVGKHGLALPFAVASRDGMVSTLGRLDREELCHSSERCEIAFSAIYRKGGGIEILLVRVEIMDLNDHSPTFPSALQEVEISESATVRMRIPLDRAVDPDAGPNGLQTYSLSSNQHFALDVMAGSGGTKQAELVVIKELDRETQSFIDLTLVAWDKGNPPRSGITKIRVNILDSNDNSPVFEDGALIVELAEDTVRGTVVINLRATDPDQGANGEIEYSLSKHAPADVQKLFAVHPHTGAVTLKGPLDYEEKRSYEVDIQARDMGPNSIPSHCKLQVKLRDVNDNAPRIHVTWTPPESPMATVSERAPNDTFLALVMVSDADSGENGDVYAHMQNGLGHFRLKRIGDNYMIVTNGSLDRENTMEYNLTLFAQDRGQPSLSCVRYLSVRVLDENDNAPIFTETRYKATFKENNKPGYHTLTVKAHDTDMDLSGKVSYAIRESNDLGTATVSFAVHPTSGVVTVLQPLDYETSHVYSFIVEASDHGHPPLTSSATVLIELQDVNDNKPEIKEPLPRNGVAVVSIPVNAENGNIVAEVGDKLNDGSVFLTANRSFGHHGYLATTIIADDADSGLNGRLRFRITDDPSNLFWINAVTGQLFVNTTNATEYIGKMFKIGIAVSDMGTSPLVTHATLKVNFINQRDHLKNSGQQAQLSFTMLLAICIGATCLLLLLAVALVTTFCRPVKRDNRAYNCREAESTYTRHPRRPQKHIHKADIQLVPALRGRRDSPSEDEAKPLSAEDVLPSSVYNMTPTQGITNGEAVLPLTQARTLRKPGKIELDGSLPRTPATPYRSLRRARNPSASTTSSFSQVGTLKHRVKTEVDHGPLGDQQIAPTLTASQATLRKPRSSESHSVQSEPDHRQMLRNLVRLSMAAFGEGIELSSASPEVQQVSQLLSLLRQGQLQPRPNFRGNKYSHRGGRLTTQDADWLSTKDSGHGESEAGDMDWELGQDSPDDPLLEEGLSNLLNGADDVFPDSPDPAWMARLSLPLSGDYHENVFIPSSPPSTGDHLSSPGGGDDSTSFSTFGKAPEKAGPLGGALLSEVSTLFEMLLTQKADAQPRPSAEMLYRLSAAYRRSLGLDSNPPGGRAHTHHSGSHERHTPSMLCNSQDI